MTCSYTIYGSEIFIRVHQLVFIGHEFITQIYWSRHIFSRSCVTKHSIVKKKIQVIIPFRIFEKFSPKEQAEALTRQDTFIGVPLL